MPGADCGSDHIPVVGTMKIKLNKRLKRTNSAPKLKLNMLENDEKMIKYSISVKNIFNALGQLARAEERWQMFKESMLESEKEHIPVAKRKEDKKWMTPEVLDLMEERRKAKADIQNYRELHTQVKKR